MEGKSGMIPSPAHTRTHARAAFLSWFVLVLAIAAGAFFATVNHVPQMVWAGDASHMTSVIAALFVGSVAWIGRQSWRVGSDLAVDASFGHLSERLAVMLGLAGTTIGLSLQAKALMSGSASFGALSTSLYTTATGVVAAGLLAVLTHCLEVGIRRATR